jgi:cytochrome c oxidase cbb3-type subunit 3
MPFPHRRSGGCGEALWTAGPAAAFLFPERGVRVTATVTLSNGEKIEGRVAHRDEFSIAITGPDGWYHSWRAGEVKSVEIHDPLMAHKALMSKYTDKDIHNLFAYLVTLK